ncbi:Receptor protein serine/threonine kinase [Trichostrongylus colubriformis]|uniref:receptor protein serine/threonine kinase n=1 Tax=Trichostrongylus colubriformis TaxID=6319 RepID=A0AAN8J153_TRICO
MTTVWRSSFDMFSLFIFLLFLPDSMDTLPLQRGGSDSSTRKNENLLLTTTPVSDPVSAILGGFNDAIASTNATVHYNPAYMARVYGKLGLNYDVDDGRPFIYCEKFDPKTCASNDPQCPVLEKCYAEPENRAQRLGCMTVFKYVTETNASVEERKIEVTLKGCWQHDKEVIADCKVQDECVAESGRRRPKPNMEFCCCRTHLCNKKVSIRVVDEAPRDADVAVDVNATITDGAMSRWMNNMWFVMLFSLIAICIAGGLLVFSLVYRWCWQNRDKEKTQAATSAQQSETYALLNCAASRPAFEITDLKHVASGRFGDVFSAIYRGGDRIIEVAVKVLKDEESWHAEQTIYIDVLRRAGHPNILRYVDVERRENEYWLITEFMKEGNLHDYLKNRILTMKQCLRIMSGMLEGLAFLHEAQGNKLTVVHRDIKSKNILLTSVESANDKEMALTACIADFGLAAVFSGPQIDDQVTGQVGTFRYMSPEVLEGATEFTVPAFQQIDVYAMALVLWEVLSRTRLSDDDEDVPPYKQPFEDVAGPYPSLGEMRDIVVSRKLRPEFRPQIAKHPMAGAIEYTIRDMWHTIADGRITASLARERINAMNGCDSQGSEGYHSSSDHNRKVSVATTISEEDGCPPAGSSLSSGEYHTVIDEKQNEELLREAIDRER